MAGKRQRDNGTWEYVFKRAGVLDKPIYMTFQTEAEGDAYAVRLETLLDRGIIPAEHRKPGRFRTLMDLDGEYQRSAHPSAKDVGALHAIMKRKGQESLVNLNSNWVDDWVTEMKRVEHLAPASVRARVGALARCTDWGMRKGHLTMPDHPFRTLPNGYAQYTEDDAAHAGQKRVDQERDRRLEAGEHEKILAVIDGGELARKRKALPLPDKEALRLLYLLALESAMRLREMYTLSGRQADIKKKTVFLDKTKNGDKRQVPMTSVALMLLESYIEDREIQPDDLLFPWWDGTKESLAATSDYLSKLFAEIFEQAGCDDLRFHDLRHEATSRLFERTTLSEAKIMKITGHKSHRMMMRYANLRGSGLAEELW